MNGEKIGATAKSVYIVTYGICLAFGALLSLLGAILFVNAFASGIRNYKILFGVFVLIVGLALLVCGICWLVYFIRMPDCHIIFSDGKLTFVKSGVQCSPTELESYTVKSHGIDGAMFGFGRIFVTVNGRLLKLTYVKNPQSVVQRLHGLKMEYAVKQNIAAKAAEQSNQQTEITEN